MTLLQDINAITFDNVQEKFKAVLEGIGGTLLYADNLQQVTDYVHNQFKEGNKYISSIEKLPGIEKINSEEDAHKLEDVEVAIVKGSFGVAENSAIWITASSIKVVVLPFICKHLIMD